MKIDVHMIAYDSNDNISNQTKSNQIKSSFHFW